jgi:L,D-transpeptidase-like protein
VTRGAACALAAALLLLLVTAARAPAASTATPCDVTYPSDGRLAWDCRTLRPGESVERLFGERWVDVLRFNRVDRRHSTVGVGLKVPRRLDDIRDFTPMPADYPDAAGEAKFILVDLAEQYLGAYERGRLVFSSPLATGTAEHPTPAGEFRITAAHREHSSSLYTIEGTDIPYPMTWALRFHVAPDGVAYWLHGRDVPGYPASHGCIGLFDEAMQQRYYGVPGAPVLDDARRLYEWAVGQDADATMRLVAGPRLRIVRGSGNRAPGC